MIACQKGCLPVVEVGCTQHLLLFELLRLIIWMIWLQNVHIWSDAALIFQALLTHGANIEAKKAEGATPLIIAAENNHVAVAEVTVFHLNIFDILESSDCLVPWEIRVYPVNMCNPTPHTCITGPYCAWSKHWGKSGNRAHTSDACCLWWAFGYGEGMRSPFCTPENTISCTTLNHWSLWNMIMYCKNV